MIVQGDLAPGALVWVNGMTPATFTVIVAGAALLGVGLLLIWTALQPARRGRICPARGCGHRNPSAAQYCARCGARLNADADSNSQPPSDKV